MRVFTVILTTFCLFSFVHAEPPKLDLAQLTGLMDGDYTVVGKKPDSKATYSGSITFHAHGQKLEFARTINGRTVRGVGLFDTVAGGDRIPVLRLHFSQDGQFYEGIYQWASDYDNYVRFTGYVYSPSLKTKAAGLEAFFPVPPPIRG